MKFSKTIAVLVAITVVGGGVLITKKMKENKGENSLSQGINKVKEKFFNLEGKPSDILKYGKPVHCYTSTKYKYDETRVDVYSDGKKNLYMHIKMTNSGKTTNSFLLEKDGYVYLWSDSDNRGMKFKGDPSGSINDESISAAIADVNNKYNYKCEGWNMDTSKFNVPSSVSFMDLDAFKQKAKQAAEETCNSLPEPQKKECLDNLKDLE